LAYADINGVRCFYTDEGEGPLTLLLIHGWAADSNDWIWLIPLLRDRYRIVACDLRGHGHSGVPDDYALQFFVDDMVGLMRHLDCEKVVPVGHSLGGAIAALLTVQHATMVNAMVAVDPAYGHEPEFVAVLSLHSLPGHAAWETATFQHPYSKATEWEGSGHCLHIERPRELATVLIRWLDGLPAS